MRLKQRVDKLEMAVYFLENENKRLNERHWDLFHQFDALCRHLGKELKKELPKYVVRDDPPRTP